MQTTFFLIISRIQDLKFTYVILIFLTFRNLAYSGTNNYLKVREFRYYREFVSNNESFIVEKKIKPSAFYTKDDKILKINNLSNSSSYFFEKKSSNEVNYLILKIPENKKNQIGFFSRNQLKYYKDNLTCSNLPNYRSIREYLAKDDFIDKLYLIDVKKLIDQDSCGNLKPEEIVKLQKIVFKLFDIKSSSIKNCFDSKTAQDVFDKDDVYRQNAIETFGKYINLVNKISSGNNLIKIKCGLSEKDSIKLASYDEGLNEIRIAVKDNKFDFPEEGGEQILFHELMHYGSQQFNCKKNSKCLDESFAIQFENICNGKKYEPSSQIFTHCETTKKAYNLLDDSLSLIEFNDGPDHAIANVAKALQAQSSAPAEAAAVTAALQSGPPVFQKVDPVDLQRIAIEPLTMTNGQKLSVVEGDGQFHNVVPSPGFLESFNRTATAFSNSVDRADIALTSAMGKAGLIAAAAIGPNAVAAVGKTNSALPRSPAGNVGGTLSSSSNSGRGSSDLAPLTTTEIILDRYLPNDPKVQAILNDPKLDAMSYAEKETYFRSLAIPNNKLSKTSKSADVKSASGNISAQQRNLASTSANAVASNSTTGGGGLSAARNFKNENSKEIIPNEPAFQKSADQDSGIDQEKGANQDTGLSRSNIANAQSGPVPARLDNKTLQRLMAFAEIKEPEYTNIRQNYKSPEFIQLLNIRKIQIYNQVGRPLWVSKNKPEKCFRDNENSKLLKQVPCQ